MNALKQMISDGDGAVSSQRVALLLIVAGIMVKNVWLSLKMGASLDLSPWEATAIGTALLAKTAQSFAENKSEPKQPPSNPPTP